MLDIFPSALSTALERAKSQLPSPLPTKLETRICDVSSESSISDAVAHVDGWGGVDIMFNNAGIMHADDADAVDTEDKV